MNLEFSYSYFMILIWVFYKQFKKRLIVFAKHFSHKLRIYFKRTEYKHNIVKYDPIIFAFANVIQDSLNNPELISCQANRKPCFDTFSENIVGAIPNQNHFRCKKHRFSVIINLFDEFSHYIHFTQLLFPIYLMSANFQFSIGIVGFFKPSISDI